MACCGIPQNRKDSPASREIIALAGQAPTFAPISARTGHLTRRILSASPFRPSVSCRTTSARLLICHGQARPVSPARTARYSTLVCTYGTATAITPFWPANPFHSLISIEAPARELYPGFENQWVWHRTYSSGYGATPIDWHPKYRRGKCNLWGLRDGDTAGPGYSARSSPTIDTRSAEVAAGDGSGDAEGA